MRGLAVSSRSIIAAFILVLATAGMPSTAVAETQTICANIGECHP